MGVFTVDRGENLWYDLQQIVIIRTNYHISLQYTRRLSFLQATIRRFSPAGPAALWTQLLRR